MYALYVYEEMTIVQLSRSQTLSELVLLLLFSYEVFEF